MLSACHAPSPKSTDDANLEYLRAVNAMVENRADWARLHAQSQLRSDPSHSEAQRLLGLSWNSGYQQSLSEAIAGYQSYLEGHDADREIRAHLIQALQLFGETQATRQHCARLFGQWTSETAPDSTPAAWPEYELAALLLCVETEQPVDATTAARWLSRAMQTAPDDGSVLLAAARQASGNGDSAAALEWAERAARADPLNADAHYFCARLLRDDGRTEEARHALKNHADAKAIALDRGDALEMLRSIHSLSALGEPPALMVARTRWQLRAGQLAAAAESSKTLRSRAELNYGDWLSLAIEAEQAGARRLARDLFQEVLDEDPEHVGARSSLALLALSSGDVAAAESLIKTARKERPEIARYLLIAGRIARQRDQSEAAISLYRQALRLAPWESRWRSELSDLLLASGMADAAKRLMDEAPAALTETP